MDGKSRNFDPGKSVVNTPLCVTGPGVPFAVQKNGNSLVLMAKVHAGTKCIAQNLLLVAQSSCVERWGALGLVLSLRWIMGTQLGMSRKIFPRPKVTLSDPSPAGSEGIEGNRSRNSSLAMSRKSSVVSWSGRPCEQLEASFPPSEHSAPFWRR